jgi:cell pole-organizing protein PopZ
MDIIDLYTDNDFEDILEFIASKKRIIAFDDFRQDVFEEIMGSKARCMRDYKAAANRVAWRHQTKEFEEDLMDYALTDDNGDTEAFDEVASRLIAAGRAVKVC